MKLEKLGKTKVQVIFLYKFFIYIIMEPGK